MVVVYAAFYFLIDANSLRYPYLLTPEHNSNVAEAAAILDGRLELAAYMRDAARFNGKIYNVYPPMFTLISLAVLTWWPEGVHLKMMFLLALPLPALAYLLFRLRTEKIRLAVTLTLCYLFGTSVLSVLDRALAKGDVYHVNHLLSQLGLLIFLLDYFGRRRIWLGGIGLLVAAWSRQLTAFYFVPLIYAAVAGRTGSARWGRAGLAVLFAAVVAALPLTLNALKFSHPLDSGYRYIYDGLDNRSANESREFGLFAPRYVPRNLYSMNLGFPSIESINRIVRFKPNPYGTGIWWTTPLLLYLLVDFRRLCTDRDARVLLAAAALVVVSLLLYHATGWLQYGYNRFSLDYIVVLLAIIAPGCDGLRRRMFTPVLTVWSVWYFRWGI